MDRKELFSRIHNINDSFTLDTEFDTKIESIKTDVFSYLLDSSNQPKLITLDGSVNLDGILDKIIKLYFESGKNT